MATTYLRFESATIKVVRWHDKIATLTNLFSHKRRQGHATGLMNMVCSIADHDDITLMLVPGRYGHPIGPDNKVLIAFYESFGFKFSESKDIPNVMTRIPNQGVKDVSTTDTEA